MTDVAVGLLMREGRWFLQRRPLDQPVMLDTNWQALEHPTLHKSMFIYRV